MSGRRSRSKSNHNGGLTAKSSFAVKNHPHTRLGRDYQGWTAIPDGPWIGVDGAKGGWVAVSLSPSGASIEFAEAIRELPFSSPARVLIDMPIGLPDDSARVCDKEARAFVSPRGSSVFPVPSRAAIFAPSYEKSCAINSATQGCKLSKQVWGIAPKIRELDTFLRDDTTRHDWIAEGHPEVAFRVLSSRGVVIPKKSSPEGIAFREGEIQSRFPPGFVREAREFVASRRGRVHIIDILDAAALAALLAQSKGAALFFGDGVRDSLGFPMRICAG